MDDAPQWVREELPDGQMRYVIRPVGGKIVIEDPGDARRPTMFTYRKGNLVRKTLLASVEEGMEVVRRVWGFLPWGSMV